MFTARDSKRERSLTRIQNYHTKKGECKMYNAGIKQYYGYTKRETERKYREEYKKTFIVNKK